MHALAWAEATRTRLYWGKVGAVLGGLGRMEAQSAAAAKAMANGRDSLDDHRQRIDYRKLRRGGYPLGSGGMESAKKGLSKIKPSQILWDTPENPLLEVPVWS